MDSCTILVLSLFYWLFYPMTWVVLSVLSSAGGARSVRTGAGAGVRRKRWGGGVHAQDRTSALGGL
jgi:hypothetical protein